jgi:hypothetical protein
MSKSSRIDAAVVERRALALDAFRGELEALMASIAEQAQAARLPASWRHPTADAVPCPAGQEWLHLSPRRMPASSGGHDRRWRRSTMRRRVAA